MQTFAPNKPGQLVLNVVGACVGAPVGAVGAAEGAAVGAVGAAEGAAVGAVGAAEGAAVGHDANAPIMASCVCIWRTT